MRFFRFPKLKMPKVSIPRITMPRLDLSRYRLPDLSSLRARVRSIRIPGILHEPLAAVAVGVAALFLVSLVKGYSFIGDSELGLQDRAYLTQADTHASPISPPFVLIDVTQKDQYRLGYPAVTPRSLIARLLTMAAAGKPRLIVLDSDLGWSGDPKEETELKNALSALASAKSPPVLMIREPFGRNDGPPIEETTAAGPDVLRPTPYDDIVSKSPNLFWVSAMAPVDGDGVSRRYLVSARVCRDGKSLLLPGVQLASCAALSDPAGFGKLRRVAADGGACAADGSPGRQTRPVPPFSCGGHDWPIGREGASADIAYRMRWILPSRKARPQVVLPGNPAPVEEVGVVDALDLADNAASLNQAERFAQFGGRIVIIGSSAAQQADNHRTSVGTMPGMLVVANAIRSSVEVGPRVRANLGLNLLVTIAMSLMTYLSWAAIQRMRGVGHFVLKEAAAPVLNLLWLFVVAVMLPTEHVLEFLYPQFAVTLYLVVIGALREMRAQALPAPAPSDAAEEDA